MGKPAEFGTVKQVIGPVIDVHFEEGELPASTLHLKSRSRN